MNRPILTAGISTAKQHLSLDKLGIVANWKDYVLKKNSDGEYENRHLDTHPEILRRTFANFPYKWNYRTVSGITFQLADKKSPVKDIRMEFNPTNPEHHAFATDMLKHMKQIRPTRIDLALDYEHDLSPYIHTTTTARKTTAYYAESGKLETLYLGGKDSNDKYRIYDKAKESNLNTTLWRIEQQLRIKPAEHWQFKLTTAFKDLFCVHPNGTLNIRDRLVLEGLQRYPEHLGHFKRDLRQKYRGMMKDATLCTPLNPTPYEAYTDLLQPVSELITTYTKDTL